MKKTVMGIMIATAAVVANAQTAPAPATQTTTATATEVKPAAASKYTGRLVLETAASTKEANESFKDAGILSAGAVGLIYKIDSTWSAEARQNFYLAANRDKLASGYQASLDGQNANVSATTLIAKQNSQATLFGSKALSHGYRLDILTTDKGQRDAGRLANLRYDTSLNYDLGTKTSLSIALSPRLVLNKETSKIGSDSILRLVGGPSVSYAATDVVEGYVASTLDVRSSEFQYGSAEFNTLNMVTHEIGANITVGSLTINPAITSDLTLGNYANASEDSVADNSGQASLFTNNSRFFAPETTSYNLNLYATF